jgi:RimJ/RimL family protein N-acetyltransferase
MSSSAPHEWSSPNVVPTVETARLTLGGRRLEDFAEYASMWGDANVTRHITGGTPATEEDSWGKFLRMAGHWPLLGFGYWLVREKATGRLVGEVGFANLRRHVAPALGEAPEIGWVLATWAWGKGYATEAARAAIAWGDTQFRSLRTVCLIHPDNRASIRVAEKCGYREFARSTYKGDPTVLFEREAPK